jgi:hypothetical protein
MNLGLRGEKPAHNSLSYGETLETPLLTSWSWAFLEKLQTRHYTPKNVLCAALIRPLDQFFSKALWQLTSPHARRKIAPLRPKDEFRTEDLPNKVWNVTPRPTYSVIWGYVHGIPPPPIKYFTCPYSRLITDGSTNISRRRHVVLHSRRKLLWKKANNFKKSFVTQNISRPYIFVTLITVSIAFQKFGWQPYWCCNCREFIVWRMVCNIVARMSYKGSWKSGSSLKLLAMKELWTRK